jgi:hypothetical protein
MDIPSGNLLQFTIENDTVVVRRFIELKYGEFT